MFFNDVSRVSHCAREGRLSRLLFFSPALEVEGGNFFSHSDRFMIAVKLTNAPLIPESRR